MKAFWFGERKNVVGLKIRELRKEKHLTIRDLAAQIQVNGHSDITENTITKIEHGDRFVPDYELIYFAEALNTNVEQLLEYYYRFPNESEPD